MSRPLRFSIGYQRATRSMSGATAKTRNQVIRQFNEINKRLDLLGRAIEQTTKEVAEEALTIIFDASQILVPVNTGDLKASGYVDVRRVGNKIVGEVGYAPRNDPPYALFVHENLEMHHKPPTQAKYLQKAVEDNAGKITALIISHLRMGI